MGLRYFRQVLFYLGLSVALLYASIPAAAEASSQATSVAVTEARRAYSEAIQAPTLDSLHEQALLLASWADAVESAGGYLPVTVMPRVSAGLRATLDDDLVALGQRLQAAALELGQNIDDRGALGQRYFMPSFLRAGEVTTIEQRYSVATQLGVGASLLLAKPWQMGRLQTDDPNAPNYIRVSTSSGAELSIISVPWQGVHGGRLQPELLPALQVTAESLQPGDEIQVVYQNLRLPSAATANFDLPLYLSDRQNGDYQIVPGSPMVLRAGEVARMTVAAPSWVERGQTFVVQVRLEDQYGNLAEGDLPSFDVLVEGMLQSRLPKSGPPSMTTAPISLDAAGTYTIEVRSSGGGIRGRSNPVIVSEKAVAALQWVDLHRHSLTSDGLQSGTELARQSQGALDLLLVADHDTHLTGRRWQWQPGNQGLKALHWSGAFNRGGHHLLVTRVQQDLHPAPAARWPDLYALNASLTPADSLLIALPEIPGDDRGTDPRFSRLVEIVSGEAAFEWYGHRLAQRGSRIGFTGSAESHAQQLGTVGSAGTTAVWVNPGESLFTALQQGRTYVTSGPRLVLEVTVNGAQPGQRVADNKRRVIQGRVLGTAGIRRIDLFKNGQIIDTINYAGRVYEPTEPVPGQFTLAVTFASTSGPLGSQRDLPRNGREWLGFIKQAGAEVTTVTAPGFRNSVRQAVALNPNQANRVDFITWTRGTSSTLFLDIEANPGLARKGQGEPNSSDASDSPAFGFNTELATPIIFELNLSAGQEDRSVLPLTRLPSATPAIRQQVSLADVLAGPITRTFNVSGYQDSVTYELIDPEAATEQRFEFTDIRDPRAGDNYMIRVQQLDDHRVWSSPVWVGGFDL